MLQAAQIEILVRAKVEEFLSERKQEFVGPPGRDATPLDPEAIIKQVLARVKIPKPRDGKDGIGRDGRPGQAGAPGKAGASPAIEEVISRVLAALPPAPTPEPGKDGSPGKDGVGFRVRGEWRAEETYKQGDLVAYKGSIWYCKHDGQGRPNQMSGVWEHFFQVGGTPGRMSGYGVVMPAGTAAGGTGGGLQAVVGVSPILASGTDTSTVSLATSGVTASTYGDGTAVPQLTLDAYGRVTTASKVNITFPAAQTITTYASDVLGTGTSPGTVNLVLSTTGVTAGTYGTGGTMVSQVTVDAKGRITSLSNVGISFPASSGGTSTATFTGDALGTATIPGGPTGLTLSTTGISSGVYGGTAGFARFDISAAGRMLSAFNVAVLGSAPVLVTVPGTGTVAFGIATSGVAVGTYGTGGTMVAQVTVNAQGFVTAASNVGIQFPASAGGTSTATFTGAVFGTGVFPGGPVAMNYSTNPNFSGTGTIGGLAATRSLRAAAGSSATLANAILSPFVLATTVSLTTVAGTLMNFNVPAAAMSGSGQGLRWSMWGTAQAGLANARRFALTLGTGTLQVCTGTAASAMHWSWEGEIVQVTTNQQTYWAYLNYGGANAAPTVQAQVGTLGMDLSTATPLNIQGTGTAASALRSQLGMRVDYFGVQ